MSKIQTAAQLVAACKKVATQYDTLYVLGCIGAPMTLHNKNRYTNNLAYNAKAARKQKIHAASADTFGFDCVCLIKSLLWGWEGDETKTYGGATYKSNGVPDIGADLMIKACTDVSTDFSTIQPGEAVWMKGHIGLYMGDGLAVECTPKWDDGVQITAVHNIGKKAGYNGRKWTSHGKLPWVTYDIKIAPAASFTRAWAGEYRVNSAIGLKLRSGAGTSYPILETMPSGSKVRCYGYHTGNWLYVVSQSGAEGFCYRGYLT